MNRKQKWRLTGIISVLLFLGLAAGFVLYALKQNINLFYTPTQLLEAHILPDQIVRVGGYVAEKSVHYDPSGTSVRFTVTDKKHALIVDYHGVLPGLFREGQGIVVTGKLMNSQILQADQVLAKHDEKYMPWPMARELKKGESNGT